MPLELPTTSSIRAVGFGGKVGFGATLINGPYYPQSKWTW
jgi:hypothetical protein